MAEVAFRTARSESDAEIILIQDGVLLDPLSRLDGHDGDIFAIERDLAVRGVSPPQAVEPIQYERLVEKCLEQEVKTFV